MKNNLHIYNTLSKQKEQFKPINPPFVGLYVCGPTVYSDVHLGNMRTFNSFDIVYRYLMHLEYKVRYVRNITDVGHLVGDGDTGEDKIEKKAKQEQIEPMQIVQHYTNDFKNINRLFNLKSPDIEPTATGHIVEQIEMVQKIIDNGLAYVVNGSVYFDVKKYMEKYEYGTLSGRKVEELLEQTRDSLEGADEKRYFADFVIWKNAGEDKLMKWNNPWGQGVPGWHLECSVMSTKYLGERFDIHGGGMDLKFPHHECEIAQNEAAKGQSPVNYWMHTNMLEMNGARMSKSTGNTINPDELLSGNNSVFSKAYAPSVIRFFNAQSSYRSVLDLTDAGLLSSEKGFYRLMDAVNLLDDLKAYETSSIDINTWKQTCYDAMNDDFNSPILIAHLFEAAKYINQIKEGTETLNTEDLALLKETVNAFVFDVLGLENTAKNDSGSDKLSGAVDVLIKLRQEARVNKDFALSDKIRDELLEVGIQLKDSRDGTTFTTN